MRRWVSILVILAVMLWAGCSRSAKYVRPYECDTVPGVKSVWDCNRAIMVQATKRKKFSLRQFWGAAEFFEELTGIAADRRDSRQGPIPGPGLRENIDSWDAWFREHEDRLVWDADTSSVRLAPSGKG
jgi:hypothetical protein